MAQSAHSPALQNLSAITNAREICVAIVSTEWNEAIIAALEAGAERILSAQGATIIHRLKVPGAVEIPFACSLLSNAATDQPDVIIAFGAVIRGGTPHFEYVCQSVTTGITQLNACGKIPVIFGVLTLDNEAQAWERLGGAHGHKGEEAAIAALKMGVLSRQFRSS